MFLIGRYSRLVPTMILVQMVWWSGCLDKPSTDALTQSHHKVIYGDDNRSDIYAYSDKIWANKVVGFTAAIIPDDIVDLSDPDNVLIEGRMVTENDNICPDERFRDQMIAALCTGTLIAEDLVLTAGHCLGEELLCSEAMFVFNYYMADDGALQTITDEDVYECSDVVVRSQGNVDYAVVRLDRSVTNRTPAELSFETSALPLGTELVVHGTPAGLPIKIDDGGWVRNNREDTLDYFLANLDTFGGNSGSGVFLKSNGALVGVLNSGEVDYEIDEEGGCLRSKVCDETECIGESVTYAFRALTDYCDSEGGGPFCSCGDGSCDADAGETSHTCTSDCGASCGDGTCNGDESPTNCDEDCGTCPNGTCEVSEESDDSCCLDCGCEGEDVCFLNICMADPFVGATCNTAVEIDPTGTQTIEDSTTNATLDYDGGCRETQNAPDHVYFFTIDEDMYFFALVVGFDTVMYLRSDCEDDSSEIACNDDNTPPGNNGSYIEETLTPGTYYLFIDGFARHMGDYVLEATFEPVLKPLDTCARAGEISVSETQIIEDSTLNATHDYSGGCSETLSPDHVYTFTLEAETEVDIMSTGFDTVIYLRSDCEDPDSQIECDDDSTPPGQYGSRITETLSSGTYFLFVDGYSNGSDSLKSGNYELTVDFTPTGVPEPEEVEGNDACEDAKLVEPDSWQIFTGDNSDMENDYNVLDCDVTSGGKDVVYTFTLTGRYDVTVESTGFDTVFYLRNDCDDRESEIVCNDDRPTVEGFGSYAHIEDLGPGDYYLILDGYGGNDFGTYELLFTFDRLGCADADNDGVCDDEDGCPEDPLRVEPGACGCGSPDTDRDGVGDCADACPEDPGKTEPGECGCGIPDLDSDEDGTLNCFDGCPDDARKLEPGVCGCGVEDVDSDRDGVLSCLDGCPNDATKTEPGVCGCGETENDSDGDGLLDCLDGCPRDPNKTGPGGCGCGKAETDSDGDRTPDCNDKCPSDPAKTSPGKCGCGVLETDSDKDGTPNCIDECPDLAGKVKAGVCGCEKLDVDSDGDGTLDCLDQCPGDANKTVPGDCGCGVPEDCEDLCPNDPEKRVPGECGCHFPDIDADEDGTADCKDMCPYDPYKIDPGECGCGVEEGMCYGDGGESDTVDTKKKGCGCVTVGVGASGHGIWGMLVLLSAVLMRRRLFN